MNIVKTIVFEVFQFRNFGAATMLAWDVSRRPTRVRSACYYGYQVAVLDTWR